ncbi:MAG: hypothetical protein WB562_15955 [Candidatus Sulfotelmatobacter sp.]
MGKPGPAIISGLAEPPEIVSGAVNKPLLEIVPRVADQVTAALLVPVIVALNWTDPAGAMFATGGEICTLTLGALAMP